MSSRALRPTVHAPPGALVSRETRWLVLGGLVVLVATALRVWHLGAGIPYALGIDEPQIMERAVRMMKTGDFNPASSTGRA